MPADEEMASSRFEKGLPPQATLAASDRAVQLLIELAGGQVQVRWLHQRLQPPAEPVPLRRDSLHQLLGPVLVDGEPRDMEDAIITGTLTAPILNAGNAIGAVGVVYGDIGTSPIYAFREALSAAAEEGAHRHEQAVAA